jgi:signal transduction histidine kinase/ligand-binding sensor domain-containing protein
VSSDLTYPVFRARNVLSCLRLSPGTTVAVGKLPRLLVWLLIALCCPNLLAVSDRTIMQFEHTAWGPQQGTPHSIFSITQTADGELWLGTTAGLFRFDGVTFDRYEDPQSKLPSDEAVTALFALPKGGLWVGYLSGVLALIDTKGAVTLMPDKDDPHGQVERFAQDKQGTLWASATYGLLRFSDGQWQRVGEDWDFRCKHTRTVFVDRKGTLWVAADDMVVYLPAGTKSFKTTGIHTGEVPQITEAPNGKIWMVDTTRSVHPIPLGGDLEPGDNTEIQVGSEAILFDHEGALWITTAGDGIRRSLAPEQLVGKIGEFSHVIEQYTAKDGLTNDVVTCIFEDQEGTIWIGTVSGLERFRKAKVVPVPTPLVLSTPYLVFGESEDMWIGSGGGRFIHLHDSIMQVAPIEFAGTYIAPYRARDGVIYWPEQTSIICIKDGRFFKIPRPGTPEPRNGYLRIALTGDRSGTLWVAVERQGIFYFKNKKWIRLEIKDGLDDSSPISAFADSLGRMWFGYNDRTIIYIDHGVPHEVATPQDSPVNPRSFAGIDQHVWVTGDGGLAFFDGTSFRRAWLANEDSTSRFRCATQLSDGSLWLCGSDGVLRIAPEQVRLSINDPSHRMEFDKLGILDGLPGNEATSIQQGSDGRVWFTTYDRIAWMDPSKISQSAPPPPVVIRSLSANGKSYSSPSNLRLQPHTRNLEVTYTAVSAAIPEQVNFKYRLDGVDRDWQVAGSRREVSYSNLGPGAYSFHVTSSSGHDVWNDHGATLSFSIAPAWFQTAWFRSLCVCIGLFLLWVLYSLRMRQVAHAISVRFDERLAERTRMARELHDTFLQTVQGSKMVADYALDANSDEARMRYALERLSLWLGQAVMEGRAALHALRISVTERNRLAEYLQQTADEQCRSASMSVAMTVLGDAKDLHPIARDEVARISEEAIRNACSHSRGSQLDIELRYADDLHLKIRDNGLGIDSSIIDSGKIGHYGLQGMRERADRISARITIRSALHFGTEVMLRIPGKVVYRRDHPTIFDRLKRLLRSPTKTYDSD